MNEVIDEDDDVVVARRRRRPRRRRRRRPGSGTASERRSVPAWCHSSATPQRVVRTRSVPPARGTRPLDAPGGGRRARRRGWSSRRATASSRCDRHDAAAVGVEGGDPDEAGAGGVAVLVEGERGEGLDALDHRVHAPVLRSSRRRSVRLQPSDMVTSSQRPSARQLDARPRRGVGQVVGAEQHLVVGRVVAEARGGGRGGGTRRPRGSGCRRRRCRRAPSSASRPACRGSRRRAASPVATSSTRSVDCSDPPVDRPTAMRPPAWSGSYQSMVAVVSPSRSGGIEQHADPRPRRASAAPPAPPGRGRPSGRARRRASPRTDGAAGLAGAQELGEPGVPPVPRGGGVEDGAGALVLGVAPRRDLGVVVVLQPAVGVGDLDAVRGPRRRRRAAPAGPAGRRGGRCSAAALARRWAWCRGWPSTCGPSSSSWRSSST